jgi:hypothetical protein
MPIKQEIIKQIDQALAIHDQHRTRSQYDDLSDLGEGIHAEVNAIVTATIDRLAPAGSVYRNGRVLRDKVGSLRALRRDYDEGYLSTVQGLIRAELFADFLEMAGHLLEQGYKDPAAVLVGGVLEEHLRALCSARSIPVEVSGRPKKADTMNSDLSRAGVYNKLDHSKPTPCREKRKYEATLRRVARCTLTLCATCLVIPRNRRRGWS